MSCRTIVDEALLAPDLLIAPVMLSGMSERAVYLPRGDWYDMRTDERFRGPATVLVDAPLDGPLPVFARAGTALPTGQWRADTSPDLVRPVAALLAFARQPPAAGVVPGGTLPPALLLPAFVGIR